MEFLTGAAAAAAVCAAVYLLLYALRGRLLSPMPTGRDLDVTVTLRARGEAEGLQQLFEGLRWLNGGSGGLEIVIVDEGMEPAARAAAAILARGEAGVSLSAPPRMC